MPAKVDQDSVMARQLSEQYQVAVSGLFQVVKFGAMMQHLRRTLSARGQGNINNLHKPGEGLSAWLAEKCPTINHSTAYRFMTLADGVKKEFELGIKVDLYLLLDASPEHLTAKQLKARAAIEDFLQGKSQRQLLLAFGNPDPKPRGGHHPGDTPPLKGEARKEDAAKRYWTNEFIARLHQEGVERKSWSYMPRDVLVGLQAICATIARDLKEVVERKPRG